MRTLERRRAFTLIEMCVVVGVLCVLAGLLLPAVQSAREASRRLTCVNNLHQMGLAIQGYESTYHCFPLAAIPMPSDRPSFLVDFSLHTRLLPWLEQKALFDAINYSVTCEPPDMVGSGSRSNPWPYDRNVANATVMLSSVGVFLCPSDGGPSPSHGTNYRGCQGVGPQYLNLPECPDSGNGLYPTFGPVAPAMVPDGLSHTAALSERLRGSANSGAIDPRRDVNGMFDDAQTADATLDMCRISMVPKFKLAEYPWSGCWWFFSGMERTTYTNAQAPNGRIPDCMSVAHLTGVGMATARSHHPGGVNVLMGDGSTRFVLETIATPVWRGFGTRNGFELVD